MADITKFCLGGKRCDERRKRAEYLWSIEIKFAEADQEKPWFNDIWGILKLS